MFTAIPCPPVPWKDSFRPYLTALLGLVGLCLGMLWTGLGVLCVAVDLPPLMTGALLTLCPWFLSGFLHLDGFLDCCDGILSRRDLEERRRILKDSHCGAFAVIAFVCLALVNFSGLASVSWETVGIPWGFVWISALPRCLSAVAVLALPSLSSSQYHQKPKEKTPLLVAVVLLVLVLGGCGLTGGHSIFCGVSAVLGWGLGCVPGYRSFQGMSGDISGYSITLGECCGLVALALF